MVQHIRRIGSIQVELLAKSREAALNAVQTFNNPLTTFKTETFIVLMVIAWTYLLHAYYRKKGEDYRYYRMCTQRKRYDRTKSGAYKYWELERCLYEDRCPLDSAIKNNLRFLIGIRHEIEHHNSMGLDEYLTGRYLACCINYEKTVIQLFGEAHSLGNALTFALQFKDITKVPETDNIIDPIPSNVAKYVQEFDAALTEEDLQSHYTHIEYSLLKNLVDRKVKLTELLNLFRRILPLQLLLTNNIGFSRKQNVKNTEQPISKT